MAEITKCEDSDSFVCVFSRDEMRALRCIVRGPGIIEVMNMLAQGVSDREFQFKPYQERMDILKDLIKCFILNEYVIINGYRILKGENEDIR